MARQAKEGDTVAVHYTGKLEDGTVFDSTRGGEPIEFSLGSGTVIGGFENAVNGMEIGQQREVTIPPEQAYGERRDDLKVDVPRDQLPGEIEPEVGQMLAVEVAPGQRAMATIANVDDQSVTLDLNHPLAGKPLVFDIELVKIE